MISSLNQQPYNYLFLALFYSYQSKSLTTLDSDRFIEVPVIGLSPGKAGTGPVNPTASVLVGIAGLRDIAEPSPAYRMTYSQ